MATIEEKVRAVLDKHTAQANLHGNTCTVLRDKEGFIKKLARAMESEKDLKSV
jgi:hypothetical protein